MIRSRAGAGAATGAATGGILDASLGGASFLLGTALGGALGGALGWLGAGRLAELSVVDRPLGGRLARYGPSRNANFPFVLFGRARYHAGWVVERTHARRDVLELEAYREGEAGSPEQLSLEASVRRSLSDLFGDLTRHAQASAGHRDAFERLTRIICAILEQDEGQGIETR